MTDIKGYEGEYAITEDGRVYSYKRKKFLKQGINKWGYYCVTLCKNGKQKEYKVHRLVATTYIPNPNNLPQVNHMDEDKSHNHWTNLEWCDQKYNNNYNNGHERRMKKVRKAVYCVELNQTFSSLTEAATTLQTWIPSISAACKDSSLKAAGYHWRFITL